MTAPRDPDRMIHAFLLEGGEELHDQVYDAVRDHIEHTRQRAVIGPWRMPDIMNRSLMLGGSAIALVLVIIVGSQLLAPGGTGGAGAGGSPSLSPTALGGTVQYQLDGAPATTDVDVVADGVSASGTAVTTLVGGTHTVRLECARDYGDTWAFGGTIERTTVPGESAGAWSAVAVKEGSPQQIAIHFSGDKSEGIDCDDWLASIDYSQIDPSNYHAVESGALVLPPG